MSKHWIVRYEYKDREPFEAKWFDAFLDEPSAAKFKELVREDVEAGHDPKRVTLLDTQTGIMFAWEKPEPQPTQAHLFIVQESLLN